MFVTQDKRDEIIRDDIIVNFKETCGRETIQTAIRKSQEAVKNTEILHIKGKINYS